MSKAERAEDGSWELKKPTREVFEKFNEEFTELCAKHKLMACACVLEDIGPQTIPKGVVVPPGRSLILMRFFGEDKMVKLVKIQFGVLKPDDL